jgi:hypothetical protein
MKILKTTINRNRILANKLKKVDNSINNNLKKHNELIKKEFIDYIENKYNKFFMNLEQDCLPKHWKKSEILHIHKLLIYDIKEYFNNNLTQLKISYRSTLIKNDNLLDENLLDEKEA